VDLVEIVSDFPGPVGRRKKVVAQDPESNESVSSRNCTRDFTRRTSCAVATTSAFYSTPLAFLLQQEDSMEPGDT
jgi:hypothetical protein